METFNKGSTATVEAQATEPVLIQGDKGSADAADDKSDRGAAVGNTNSRRWWPVLILIGLVAVVWTSATNSCTAPSESPATSKANSVETLSVKRVRVGVVAVGSIKVPTLTSRFRGVVIPRRGSELAFRRSGRIDRIMVDTGDTVTKNEIIASLDVADLLAQSDLDASELEVAAAAYEEALAGPRRQTIQSAEARVEQLSAQLRASKQRLTRRQRLFRSSSISKEEVTDEKAQVDRLSASVSEAESVLEELLAGTRNEQVKAARARVSMARAAAELTKVQLRDSQIKAPFDCVVGERLVDEGTIVGPNQIVVSILEKPPLEASFGVPADAVDRLRIGQTANLSIGKNSLDQPTIVGRVVRLQPKVDSITRTREVVVEFDTEEISLIGQSATLWLDRETPTNEVTSGASTRFWIPSEALVRNVRGLWGLYVAKTNRSDAADVVESGQEIDATIGLVDAKLIQTAGLMTLVEANVQPPCLVVAAGTHRVGPNVKIIAQRNDD